MTAARQLKQSTVFELLKSARDVIATEADALNRLANKIPIDFERAVKTLVECRGSVIVTGIGKAGWIGQKISASFASTGTRSHFLHPSEAMHGDLGRVGSGDIILVLSNSGETPEIVQLLPAFEKAGVPVISIVSSDACTLARGSSISLAYGSAQEACHLGLAPSTSTTLMLALGDALALVTSQEKRFQSIDFAKFHPGGSLGKKLSSVNEIMRPIENCRLAYQNETVREIYVRLHGPDRRTGAILLTDDDGKLTGIFTDSDLARLLERQQDELMDGPIHKVMTQNPKTARIGSKTAVAVEILACNNISELPVVDARDRPRGIIDITDVVGILPRS